MDEITKPEKIKKPKSGIWLKIFSVLTAVLIWFWVVGVNSQITQKKFASIPVKFDNLTEMRDNYGYSIIVEKELYIDVTLEGKSADLNRIKSEEIYAYIDLGRVSQAGEISLPIEIKEMDYAYVAEQSQSSTLLYIDRTKDVPIPVDVKIVQMVKVTDVDIGELELSFDHVLVYGPERILRTLDRARVELSLGAIDRPVTVTEKFTLINKNGEEVKNQYISTRDITTIEVTVPVTITKEIPLNVNFRHGYYNPKNSKISIIPEKITIKGPPDIINGILEHNIGVINEKQIESETESTLTIPVILPDGVASETRTADVEIKFMGLEPKLINVSIRQNNNFNVIPPENFEYHIKEDRIQIKILGSPEVLRAINSSRISAAVDLSAITESGSYPVPVNIVINRNDTDNPAFCVGEYLVTAEIY